jgi:DeoR family transcriptional regulator of aga operon
LITQAANIAQELMDRPAISVIMIGRIMRHVSGSFVDPQADRSLTEFHADHFFLGVDGLDPVVGFSTPDLLEAQVNKLTINVAKEVTIIADASKFGRHGLSIIGHFGQMRRLIIDSRVSEEQVAAIRELGVEVLIV